MEKVHVLWCGLKYLHASFGFFKYSGLGLCVGRGDEPRTVRQIWVGPLGMSMNLIQVLCIG